MLLLTCIHTGTHWHTKELTTVQNWQLCIHSKESVWEWGVPCLHQRRKQESQQVCLGAPAPTWAPTDRTRDQRHGHFLLHLRPRKGKRWGTPTHMKRGRKQQGQAAGWNAHAGASALCFLALQRPLSLKAGAYTTGSFVLPEYVFQRDYVSYWTGVEVCTITL